MIAESEVKKGLHHLVGTHGVATVIGKAVPLGEDCTSWAQLVQLGVAVGSGQEDEVHKERETEEFCEYKRSNLAL